MIARFLRTLPGRLFPLWTPQSANERHRRSWIGHVFRLVQGRYILGSALITAMLYVGGLAVAQIDGFGHAYVDSSIWALALTMGWVFAWGEWSDRALYALPDELKPAIRDPFDEKGKSRWYDRFYDTPRDLTLGFALAVVLVWLTFRHEHFWTKRLDGWKSHELASELILSGYFTIGAFLASSMLYGFWNYICFVEAVLRRRLTFNLALARSSLRHLTSFGLATGFGWSVAVALFAEMFARRAAWYALALIAALALLGFALILVPQWLAHNALAHTRDELLRAAAANIDEDLELTFVVGPDPGTARLRAFIDELQRAPSWIYSPAQALVFTLQIAGTMATIFLHKA